MALIGKRSNISRSAAGLVFFFCLLGARSGRALDVFTLWRQPEIPLHMIEGGWVEYRTQTLTGGRSEQSVTRIACLDRDHGTDDDSWLLELLPLSEEDGAFSPISGEGMQLRVSRKLLLREGGFLDAIVEAVQWRAGASESVSAVDLRQDPLVSATLSGDFVPDMVERKGSTTRVVGGAQFLCDQLVMSAIDTLVADLPAGKMIQITTREIVAAVHAEVPFLGLVYVSERVRSESHLEPPSRRFKQPPPRVRVEVMELVGFGGAAMPVLGISAGDL